MEAEFEITCSNQTNNVEIKEELIIEHFQNATTGATLYLLLQLLTYYLASATSNSYSPI